MLLEYIKNDMYDFDKDVISWDSIERKILKKDKISTINESILFQRIPFLRMFERERPFIMWKTVKRKLLVVNYRPCVTLAALIKSIFFCRETPVASAIFQQ